MIATTHPLLRVGAVLKATGDPYLRDGRFRVVYPDPDKNDIYLFALSENDTAVPRSGIPEKFILSEVAARIGSEEKTIQKGELLLPPYIAAQEQDIDPGAKKKRNELWRIIKPLSIGDEYVLVTTDPVYRQRAIRRRAAETGHPSRLLIRLMIRLWYYCCGRKSLTPAWQNCGGKGKPRVATEKDLKRGRPPLMVVTRHNVVMTGVNTLEVDRKNIIDIVRTKHIVQKWTYQRCYEYFKDTYCVELQVLERDRYFSVIYGFLMKRNRNGQEALSKRYQS